MFLGVEVREIQVFSAGNVDPPRSEITESRVIELGPWFGCTTKKSTYPALRGVVGG